MEQELICRTCLSNTSNCISINATPSYCGKTFTISTMIMACAPVEISEGDGLPSKICDNCLKHLQVSFMFRIRALQANEKLKDYLQTKLIPNQQPVSKGFIEPLVLPSLNEDINKSFSWDQVLQSTENESDPLIDEPLTNLIDEDDIKIEPKNEILPIEEVMLPTNIFNYSAEKTEEPYVLLTNAASESTISESNSNLLNQSPPLYNWSNSSINKQQNTYDLKNTERNSNVPHLSETDTHIIQSLLQTMQDNQCYTNTKFILVKTNEPETKVNNEHLSCGQTTDLPNSSQNKLQSSTSNKNINLPNNTSFNVNFKKPEKQTFEDELKKFVEKRQKYYGHRQDAFCFKPTRQSPTPTNRVKKFSANIKTFIPQRITPQKIIPKPILSRSTDLTFDVQCPASLVPITSTNFTTNLDSSEHNVLIENDQSTCIIIDD